MGIRGELHLIELDLAIGDTDIWGWWTGGFARFLDWCAAW